MILAELMKRVIATLDLKETSVNCWCDSTVVVNLIKIDPEKLDSDVRKEVNRLKVFGGYSWT